MPFPVNFEKRFKCPQCSMFNSYKEETCNYCGYEFKDEELKSLRQKHDVNDRKGMVVGTGLSLLLLIILLILIESFT